jgi:O-antigen/teichoic acid export membrane protein
MTESAFRPEGLRRQLLRAARGSVILRTVAFASTMATSVVLARALGPSAYGTYAYVFAIVTLLALPSQVGIPTLLVRETAKAQAHEDWPRLKGLWTWATRVILVTSVAVAVVAAVSVAWRGARTDADLRWTLAAGLLLVPLIALGNARGAALRGLRKIVSGQLPETVLRPVMLVVFVGMAYWFGGRMSAHAAMAWHALAAALAFAVGGAILWRARPAGMANAHADLSQSRAWWQAALPLALISGLQVAGNQSGLIQLGWFRPQAEVGLYKVATSASTLALFGLQTANLVIAPHIARLHALDDHARLQRLASIGALASGALTLPVFLAFAFGGRWLISLLYGANYVDAYGPLLVLCGAQMVNAYFGLNAGFLSMTGHEKSAARWLSISSIIAISSGFFLIPVFGMMGAALSQFLSMLVWNVAFWRIALAKTGVDSSLSGVFRYGVIRLLRRD